jgi:hypothetical protein
MSFFRHGEIYPSDEGGTNSGESLTARASRDSSLIAAGVGETARSWINDPPAVAFR